LRDQGALRGRKKHWKHDYSIEDAYRLCVASTLRNLGFSVRRAVSITNQISDWFDIEGGNRRYIKEPEDRVFRLNAKLEGVDLGDVTLNVSKVISLVNHLFEQEGLEP